jgi:DNA (cytosine-5)-methyltransferase 1
MTNKISMIELFSGIGAQERALRQLGLPYEVTNTCDCDANAVLSYAAMRWDLEKEMETFEFPSQDEMIEELQAKNLGYDFQKGKHSITKRTPIPKLKQYYIADKLSKNLGDISKVEKLPYSDLWTYSYPCTDLSVAGKGEGMIIKCDRCEHTWPIDFEHPENNNACPKCGNIDIASTRSGLLGQVQRLLTVSYEEGILPKYLLLENVKNLVGKKFKVQFDAWVNWLDLIGYNTYWKIINSKHMGIPQNRERVFAISIRKDVDVKGFTFPEVIPLITRLKDMLEKDVPEQYYLPDDRIEKILNSTFMQEKKRIQMTDVCNTLQCVSIEEDTNPIRIGNIYDENFGTGYAGNVWDKDGVSPTLQTAQGGNRMPLVLDEIKVIGNYMPSNHDASRVVDIDGIAPTVKENHGTVTAIAEPFVVASRGRNPENPSDRTTGVPTEQRLEPNFSGCTNTLTSVQKDNYVCEPQVLRAERTEYGKTIRKQYEAGEVDEKIGNMREMKPRTDGVSNTITTVQKDNYVIEPIIYDDYNSRISSDQDAINTLTCNCGASAERNGVKIIEPIVCEERKDEGIRLFKDDCVGTLRTIDACGDKRVIEPELMIEDITFPVMVRKYPVDCNLLCQCLRDYKYASNFSNREIADTLNIPLTKVEHWFRQDECFAIPDADIWFKLKELLGITTNEFDESIMTFEIKDGIYDKANRCYHIEGIAPTLTAASANEKIIEPQLEFVGGLGDKDWAKDGKQLSRNYPQGSRVYSSDGIASALTAQGVGGAGGFSGLYTVDENIKWRIRKLMPIECWKLMAFSSEDHNRAAQYVSNSALYKQAGNSIVVNVLIALMSSLFIENGHKAEVWTKYALNPNE